MPELPEVESIRRTLEGAVLRRPIVAVRCSALRLRRELQAESLRRALVGTHFVAIEREAKYLIMKVEGRSGAVLAHLGMTGRMLVVDSDQPEALHTHVVLGLEGGVDLRYVDVRRFGFFSWIEDLSAEPALTKLGLDPLAASFDAEFVRLARGRRTPIKALLMDQAAIGGIGNIYASEALWMSGVHPRRASSTISEHRLGRLAKAIREVLLAAIEGGGSTIKDFVLPYGESGGFVRALTAYGHEGEPCGRCGEAIKKIQQGGRSTFYCARCQR